MNKITITILFIIIIILALCMLYILYEKNKLKKIKFYESIDFESKHDIIHRIINEEVDRYKILNFAYEEDELYITEDMQKEMINVVTTKTIMRITPAIMVNLKLIYNINDNNNLINIIGELVSLKVLDYSIETNIVKNG